nr:zinc finger, CCHC-type [Tanacetum cinerariifolium]
MARGSTVKEMSTNFGKLDKFEGHDFRRWQKNMHFLLTTLKVVYVLTTPMPELLEDDTVEAIRRRAKMWNLQRSCKILLNPSTWRRMLLDSVIIMARGSTVKEMSTNFGKLDKFEGHDFRRWQKNMHFLLTTLKVVYVLTTPMPELLEDDTVEAIRRRAK